MDYLINIANILYLLSYLVRDILWLRILTVIAAVFLIAYFYTRPDPLYVAIYWNLLFTSLNVFWVGRLLLERRPVSLTGNDLRLYQLVFRCLTPAEMKQLLKLGRWEKAEANEYFICQGDALERLMVICSGKAKVMKDGKVVEELGDGQFIGGIPFATEVAAPADVIAIEDTYYMSWPKQELKSFLESKTELHMALQLTLGFDLVKRLEATYVRG
jgi:CRP-like cAMP-binding protein